MLVKSGEMLGDVGELFNLSEYRFLTYKTELITGVATAEDDDTICIISGKALHLMFFLWNPPTVPK